MESDMRKCLDELIEWWKEYQSYDEIEGVELHKLRDIMARLCLKYVGRDKV